jgi:hypothetical protein
MSETPQSREPAPPEAVVGLASAVTVLADLVAAARNELAILSYRLEPALYGAESVVEAMRAFALRHERVRVRILVNQPDLAMRRAHRLVELARKLPSRFEFRELSEEQRGIVDDCVIVDVAQVWRRESVDHFESRLFRNAPLEAQLQLRRFDPLWEQSPPAQALRELRL